MHTLFHQSIFCWKHTAGIPTVH